MWAATEATADAFPTQLLVEIFQVGHPHRDSSKRELRAAEVVAAAALLMLVAAMAVTASIRLVEPVAQAESTAERETQRMQVGRGLAPVVEVEELSSLVRLATAVTADFTEAAEVVVVVRSMPVALLAMVVTAVTVSQ
jgi:hypothetical protein